MGKLTHYVFAAFMLIVSSSWAREPINPQITRVAEQWVQLLDDEQYEKAWQATASAYKEIEGRDHFDRMTRGVRMPLGMAVARKLWSEWSFKSMKGRPDGQYYYVRFNTDFKNKHSETFETVWLEWEEGLWRVTGYSLR